MKYNPRDEDSIKAVMAKANVVINLIGAYVFKNLIFYWVPLDYLFDIKNHFYFLFY